MSRVAINTGASANDATGDTLRAAGGTINSNFLELYTYLGAGSTTALSAPVWSTTSVGINTLRNVGIGTTNPTSALVVSGDARVTGILTIGTASITLNGSTNRITVGSGVTIDGSTGIISATSLVLGGTTITGAGVTSITAGSGISINQSTGNVTVTATGGIGTQWVTTSVGIHTLSNVGIGTTNPTSALTVVGSGTSTTNLYVTGVSTFNGTTNLTATNIGGSVNISAGGFAYANNVTTYYGSGSDGLISFLTSTNTFDVRVPTGSKSLVLGAGPSVKITNEDGLTNRAVFTSSGVTVTGVTSTSNLNVGTGGTVITTTSGGLVGIGTTNPTEKLSVVGVVSATSFYGDASNTVSGRWTLGANGSSDYTFTGIGFTQTTNDPVLYLARGRVYEFVNNSGGSHPFQIRASNGGSAYSDGVTNNGAASGVIRFEIPFSSPNTLYYQCTNHSGMGNTISVYPSTI